MLKTVERVVPELELYQDASRWGRLPRKRAAASRKGSKSRWQLNGRRWLERLKGGGSWQGDRTGAEEKRAGGGGELKPLRGRRREAIGGRRRRWSREGGGSCVKKEDGRRRRAVTRKGGGAREARRKPKEGVSRAGRRKKKKEEEKGERGDRGRTYGEREGKDT